MNLLQKINVLFTKSELKKVFLLFVGILIMGLFEVVGVSSIVPFIAVVTSPDLIHENIYLNPLYVFFDFQTEVNFIVFLGICVISILLISNSYLAFMYSVITYFSSMQSSRLQIRLLEIKHPYSLTIFLSKTPTYNEHQLFNINPLYQKGFWKFT